MLRVVDISDCDCSTNVLTEIPRFKNEERRPGIMVKLLPNSIQVRQAILKIGLLCANVPRDRLSIFT